MSHPNHYFSPQANHWPEEYSQPIYTEVREARGAQARPVYGEEVHGYATGDPQVSQSFVNHNTQAFLDQVRAERHPTYVPVDSSEIISLHHSSLAFSLVPGPYVSGGTRGGHSASAIAARSVQGIPSTQSAVPRSSTNLHRTTLVQGMYGNTMRLGSTADIHHGLGPTETYIAASAIAPETRRSIDQGYSVFNSGEDDLLNDDSSTVISMHAVSPSASALHTVGEDRVPHIANPYISPIMPEISQRYSKRGTVVRRYTNITNSSLTTALLEPLPPLVCCASSNEADLPFVQTGARVRRQHMSQRASYSLANEIWPAGMQGQQDFYHTQQPTPMAPPLFNPHGHSHEEMRHVVHSPTSAPYMHPDAPRTLPAQIDVDVRAWSDYNHPGQGCDSCSPVPGWGRPSGAVDMPPTCWPLTQQATSSVSSTQLSNATSVWSASFSATSVPKKQPNQVFACRLAQGSMRFGLSTMPNDASANQHNVPCGRCFGYPQEFSAHLRDAHNIPNSKNLKGGVTCAWAGCMGCMSVGSYRRHIIEVHAREWLDQTDAGGVSRRKSRSVRSKK